MKLLKYMLVLLVFFAIMPAFPQTKAIDSLKTLYNKATADSEKAILLNQIAAEYESDPGQMMTYAKKALTLTQQKGLTDSEADAWFNIGNANIIQSRYANALKSFTNAQQLYEDQLKDTTLTVKQKNNIKYRLSLTYGSIGVVCSEQNNYSKSLEYYFKSLKWYEETKQEDVVATLYNNIGIVYESQKEYGKALDYFNKALWIQKKIDEETSAITITNIGRVYLARNEDDKALQSFREAEALFKKDINSRGLAELYNNIGNYYQKKNDYKAAEKNYREAFAIFEKTEDAFGASAALGFLGHIYALQKNDEKAIEYLNRSSALAQQIDVPNQILESEKLLSELYEKKGNAAQALQHYKKYTIAKEIINNAENIKSQVREEMNFEFERKAALQRVENEKQQALFNEQAKRHVQQMIFSGLFALLAFSIVFLIYSRLQLKKRLTLQRDLAEYEQKALHLQMNPHFVFNCLGSISSFIVQNGTDQAIKYLAKFSKLMRLTLEYSKESLIPIDREIESLQNYLELEQLRFNKIFDFSITKDPNIEDDMALPPLLLQPFVENAIIHGIVPKKQMGSITVDFKLANDALVCTITDDGIGVYKSKKLKENSVTVHKSMAMEITKKRLEVIQAVTAKTAHIEIKELFDAHGNVNGTKITLNLPIQYSSN
jgi:tetratricopeptide (TPR) repeat protein